jgi:sugar phosphate isomerase/epimerase
MKRQRYQIEDREIVEQFIAMREQNPAGSERLSLSWSNWGFGMEPLPQSATRLQRAGITRIELHGNRYGPDLGYRTTETKRVLDEHGISVAGVCGMVSPDSELSSNKPHVTQRSIDYFRRNADMCAELGGSYVLFAPGAVGRPQKYDDMEATRAAQAIRILAPHFESCGVRIAIEPVRAAEVSFCHTVAEAKELIRQVDHPAVQHICGDLYHLLAGEPHVGNAILEAGEQMINLHMADSTRGALGTGSLNLDIIIMALYLTGFHTRSAFCTPEPLGPGGDPYPAMWGNPEPHLLDKMVLDTARYFREREEAVLSATPKELRELYP